MAWPPAVLPVNRTDSLNQQANHPADHNQTNQAVNDTVAQVQAINSTIVGHYRADLTTDTGGNVSIADAVWHPGVTTVQGYIVDAGTSTGYIRVSNWALGTVLAIHVEVSTDSGVSYHAYASAGISIFIVYWGTRPGAFATAAETGDELPPINVDEP